MLIRLSRRNRENIQDEGGWLHYIEETMKIKFYLLYLFCLFCLPWCIPGSLLNATIWHIKQDGTGNFNTIQEGIIAATDYDTILVYPGTYYENIDYLEKSLTVASLYLITPADSLIDQTIIDGNQQFRCITINDCENASLIGFTIQNGLAFEGNTQGQYGGGVYIRYVLNAFISNCKIKNNKAYSGGGLFINHTNIIFENNIISYNWGVRFGGGISIYGNDTVVQFSEINLNNIYFNYSSTGSDISITEVVPPLIIFVDTLTVSEPDYYYINPSHKYTFYGLHSKIEQIDQDLYVSSVGDDNNSGLTSEEPLKTISWAQTLIKRNDENPHTIYLAPGIYSPSLNNQKFPLNIKQGVNYVGTSPEEIILDAEEQTPFFRFFSQENIYVSLTLHNLTLKNGNELPVSSAGAIDIYYQADLNLDNVIVKNNSGGDAISLIANYQNQNPVLNVEIHNSLIKNNIPGYDEGSGGGMSLHGHFNIPGNYNAKLINCEISGNHDNFYNPQTGMGGAAGLYIGDNLITDVVNCTFGDNTLDYSTGCVISVLNAELNIYNSILYNNDGHSFIIWNNEEVNISHSLIEGGNNNVHYYLPGEINWLEGNLDENPMFDSLGIYPFALLENSPCIDAGTLDLPPGIELPEFDLAGNPRIYGETIDMGAYEWQDSVSVLDNIQSSILNTQLSNYPNPFNPSVAGAGRSPATTISFSLNTENTEDTEIVIYNLKGQKIRQYSIFNPSKAGHGNQSSITWDGTDENNQSVSSGIYFYKLKVNGEEKAVRKCILLK